MRFLAAASRGQRFFAIVRRITDRAAVPGEQQEKGMSAPRRMTVANALDALSGHDEPFRELFRHGSLTVEVYRPEGVDTQQPHSRDEICVVAAGSGWFVSAETRRPFEAGEVLFVPAGVVHRFEDFSDDFATWVFFYGPEGGEADTVR
jgi:mannose-6-phosphate isomerase-like protein (cupin superfamily)